MKNINSQKKRNSKLVSLAEIWIHQSSYKDLEKHILVVYVVNRHAQGCAQPFGITCRLKSSMFLRELDCS